MQLKSSAADRSANTLPSSLRRAFTTASIGMFLIAGSAWYATAQGDASGAPSYYYESDFTANSTLVASPSQVVILSLASGSLGDQRHVIRYQLPQATYNLCLGNDPALTTMTIAAVGGPVLAKVGRNICTEASLPSGTYTINIGHNPGMVHGNPRIVFAQLPAVHVKVNNPDGTPKSGYWAIQTDPAQDPSGQHRVGRLHSLPEQDLVPPNSGLQGHIYGMPVVPDWSSARFDDTDLFNLDTHQLYLNDAALNMQLVPVLDDRNLDVSLFISTPRSPASPPLSVVIEDRTDNRIRISATSPINEFFPFLHNSPRWAWVGPSSFLFLPPLAIIDPPPPSLLASLAFRFFPESKGLTAPEVLDEGEAAFFQSCSYGGSATVFFHDVDDVAWLATPVTNLGQVNAIKLGPGTEAVLYTQPNYGGTGHVVSADSACLDTELAGERVASFQVRPVTPKFAVSSTCLRCQLQAANLSNSVLDHATLDGSVLAISNLAGTSLTGANMNDVDLSGADVNLARLDLAVLSGSYWYGTDLRTASSFRQITLNRAAGFAGADLQGIDLSNATLQDIDFNFTNLTKAKFIRADLTGADLVNAQLTGADMTGKAILVNADAGASQAGGLQLIGANLRGSSWFGVQFDEANLSNANLTDSFLIGSGLANATMIGTVLNGIDLAYTIYSTTQLRTANLNQAIFDGATINKDLSGVNFSGASLKKVVFYQCTFGPTNFTGADLTGASFQPQFQDLNLSNTNFTRATLIDAIFSAGEDNSITLGNARFAGAKMNGAQFVSTDFARADLTGADLTGANLTSAHLTQVASMNGAILDGAVGLQGANLTGVPFGNIFLRNTNLSGAQLYGTQLNNANLDGSNLSGVYLTKPPSGNGSAANLSGAFLRNVNLSKAQLSGANFTDANFYGTNPAGTGGCALDPTTGFTIGCASASGATMNSTQFSGAYLFGVDFTGAIAQGVQFGNAVLAGANFNKATLSADTSGANTGFTGAFLQGTVLAGISLENGLSLDGAFVDFSSEGNTLYLNLNGQHTTFAGYWGTSGQPVCAEVSYYNPTSVPLTDSSVVCPNGSAYSDGCGTAFETDQKTPNPNWRSNVDITQEASYQFDATFTSMPASGNPICAYDPKWLQAPQTGTQRKKVP